MTHQLFTDLSALDLSQYDYLDFGCSNGNSIPYGASRFGGRAGLGIDIDPAKVARARQRLDNGEIGRQHMAICADILQLHKQLPKNQFRFVTCIHFLEHLHGFKAVQQILFAAARVCNEFVYLVQPNADRNQYLFELGLKTYYSDWKSHAALLTSYDFYRLCEAFRRDGIIKDFVILQTKPIADSSDPCIHPLSSPREQHAYDPALHPPKGPVVPLERVYQDISVFMILDETVPLEKYMDKACPDRCIIYDSRRPQA